MATKKVLIVAGEASGDMHASSLVQNLKELNPKLSFFGIGGKKMESSGVELVERMEKLSIIGVSELFAKIKDVHAAYRKILSKVSETPPDLAILVDYPGFNLNLAKKLKQKKIPVIYYITPQVWAWGKSRVFTIKKYVDKAIVILKFEEELFKNYAIDATFVGHPLLDSIKALGAEEVASKKISLGLDGKRETIALLPGSRTSEVKRMLPVMLRACKIISQKKDVQYVLLKNSSVDEALYRGMLERSRVLVTEIKDDTSACLSLADFVFTSSGTATLECALMEKPMIIIYKTSFLTAFLFKIFVHTPFIGLVNVIAKKEIVPEILQYDATPAKLAGEILSIISSQKKIEEQVSSLREVKMSLGTGGAAFRAAGIIDSFIRLQQ